MVKFRSNELVWAKWMNSYWPAVALDPCEWKSLDRSGLQPKSDSDVLVYWIQSAPKTAMQIVNITDVQHFLAGFSEKFSPTTKSTYRIAVKSALKIAGQSDVLKKKSSSFGALSKIVFAKQVQNPVYVSSANQWKLVFPKSWHKKMVDKFFVANDGDSDGDDLSNSSRQKIDSGDTGNVDKDTSVSHATDSDDVITDDISNQAADSSASGADIDNDASANQNLDVSESSIDDIQSSPKEKNFWDSIEAFSRFQMGSSSSSNTDAGNFSEKNGSTASEVVPDPFPSRDVVEVVDVVNDKKDKSNAKVVCRSKDAKKVADKKETKMIEMSSSDPCVLYSLTRVDMY